MKRPVTLLPSESPVQRAVTGRLFAGKLGYSLGKDSGRDPRTAIPRTADSLTPTGLRAIICSLFGLGNGQPLSPPAEYVGL